MVRKGMSERSVFLCIICISSSLFAEEVSELWSARYDGPAGRDDSGNAIAVDSEGNVYVTGESEGLGSGSDYATVKYSPEGEELWVARYDGPAGGDDSGNAITVDSEGNVYVSGICDYLCNQRLWIGGAYATVKYNSNGEQLWVARYDEPAGEYACANAIAVDSEGNVYVTGSCATLKYSPEGEELWVAPHVALARGLALDTEGNVYVMGVSDGGYAIVKYSPSGEEVWIALWACVTCPTTDWPCWEFCSLCGGWLVDGPENGWGRTNTLTFDNEGNVYVTAICGYVVILDMVACDSCHYATVKYSSAGEELCVTRYDGPVDRLGPRVTVDSKGNVYFTGESEADYLTVKYSQRSSEFRRSDTNTDNNLDIADAVLTLSYLFAEGPAPSCLDAADANDDGALDLADGIYILQNLFANGPAIPPPYRGCGVDPTVDELGCESFPACE